MFPRSPAGGALEATEGSGNGRGMGWAGPAALPVHGAFEAAGRLGGVIPAASHGLIHVGYIEVDGREGAQLAPAGALTEDPGARVGLEHLQAGQTC
jgi:hypothetical protein